MKRAGMIIVVLIVAAGAAFFAGMFDRTPTIAVERDCWLVFTTNQPSDADENMTLCVPAAYSTDDGHIIGHYSTGGKRKGTADYRYTTIHLDQDTHFQQASLVRNHQPKFFSDRKRRYRRALCKSNGQYYIVHSSWPVTLTSFAHSLSDYDYAWNLDMGTYAYGWYRDESGLHRLGSSAFWNRHRQTNWIVARKKY